MAKEAVFGPPTKWEGGKPPDRLVRPTMPMAGWGGYVEVYHPLSVGEIGGDLAKIHHGSKIEVVEWRITPINTWVEIPMCGNFGAMSRRLVCTDFKWSALLVWDISTFENPKAGNEEDPLHNTFLDENLQGAAGNNFLVAMLFQLGEPAEYPNTTGEGAFYYCDRVAFEQLQLVDRSTLENAKTIHGVISGKGSAPLRRYYKDAWVGAGGMNFGQTAQGH